MRAISFALACLACAAQGRRVHTMTDRAQRTLNDESKPAQSLAKTLLGFNIPAAVSRKTAPQRASSPAMELYQEGKAIPEPDPEVASRMSRAMPFLKAPAYLDGSMPGDQGFDPMGMSTTVFSYGSNINYYREAELMHGRQAMLAVVGFIWPSVFGKLNVDWAQDVSYNPLYAVFQLPAEVYAQLAVFMIAAESLRANVIFNEDREPGDHGFDPLDFQGKFCKTPEELFVMKEKELANGRLAMIAFVGLVIQLTEKGEAPPFI